MSRTLAAYSRDVAKRLSQKVRDAVIKRDGRLCYLCGRMCVEHPGNKGIQQPNTLTVDHVVPLRNWKLSTLEDAEREAALREANRPENLAVACNECNGCKDDMMPADEVAEAALHLLMARWHYMIPRWQLL